MRCRAAAAWVSLATARQILLPCEPLHSRCYSKLNPPSKRFPCMRFSCSSLSATTTFFVHLLKILNAMRLFLSVSIRAPPHTTTTTILPFPDVELRGQGPVMAEVKSSIPSSASPGTLLPSYLHFICFPLLYSRHPPSFFCPKNVFMFCFFLIFHQAVFRSFVFFSFLQFVLVSFFSLFQFLVLCFMFVGEKTNSFRH